MSTNYKDLAKNFIENYIQLIDRNRFIDLFTKAVEDCNTGTVREIRRLLDNADVDYKSQLERELYNIINKALIKVFIQETRQSIPIVDFYEFYIVNCLGYELNDVIEFLNKYTFEVPIQLYIENIDGYETTIIARIK